MTLLSVEAFDDGLHTYRNGGNGLTGGNWTTTYGKDGTRGFRSGENSYIRNAGGTHFPNNSNATVVIGAWVQFKGSNTDFLWFRDTVSTASHLEVDYIGTDGHLDFICGSGTFSSSAGTIPTDQWCFVEVKLTVNATTGSFDCWVDGSSIMSQTNKDTYGAGNTYTNWFQLGHASAFTGNIWWDSYYFLNAAGSAPFNDKLGVVRIHQDLPTGNGNSSVLVGSDGNSTNNYQQVDDLPASESTYNGSSTQGDKDTYAFGSLPSTSSSILGVVVSTLTEKNDVGAKFGRIVNRSGSTDYAGTTYELSQGYSLDWELLETDPDTASAWTESGYNAAEHGWEVRDS